MSAEQWQIDRERLVDEADANGREAAYRAAREAGGAGGMLDVFDAAVIRTIIQRLAPDPLLRYRFWEDVRREIEK